MLKNDRTSREENPSDRTESLVKSSNKPSMSRTLVHRTNKEFDKCAELLRNILTVQETRRNSKSSNLVEVQRKTDESSPTSQRTRKSSNKLFSCKCSSCEQVDRRSSHSPSKSLVSSTGEEQSSTKNRSTRTQHRKQSNRSPSPSKTSSSATNKTRLKSSSSPTGRSTLHRHNLNQRTNKSRPNLVRSSSCGDLPSKKHLDREQKRFIDNLNQIREISKTIRSRNSTTNNNDGESSRLWHNFDTSLCKLFELTEENLQPNVSIEPLREEILQLRRHLKSTSEHLREFDQRRNEENHSFQQRKFDENSFTQLCDENEKLNNRCNSLQEKLENSERLNIRLIERATRQNLRYLAEPVEQSPPESRFLVRDEVLLLRENLYHVYDDLATLFNRNRSLELSNIEQKEEIKFYKDKIGEIRQSAETLLHEIDKRSTDEKIKRFLTKLIVEPNSTCNSPKRSVKTRRQQPTVNPSLHLFETPHKLFPTSSNHLPSETTNQCRDNRPNPPMKKLRPKSLFITATVLNDATALSKFHQNRSSNSKENLLNSSSSSTICDAESLVTSSSSFKQNQMKRLTFYNSLPTLNLPLTKDFHDARLFELNANESGPELDQISDLTSKMFSSAEDESTVGVNSLSNSSESSSSTIEIVS